MGEYGVEEKAGSSEEAHLPARRGRRAIFPLWLSRLGAGVLVLVAVGAIVAVYLVHHAEPMLRRRVVATLEERFHSPVELDALHITLRHGLEVTGSGLRILYLAGPSRPDAHLNAPPMLTVENFEFRSGLRELFEPTMRVVTVYAHGMRLNIPPGADLGPLFPNGAAKDNPQRRWQPRIGLVVDKIVCSDLILTIETAKPGKLPLVFDIRSLTMREVGFRKPLLFDASLVNPKPVGDIHSSGDFGPWQDDNPRNTHIDGEYTFTHANLASIKGIAGTLSSTGRYSGSLGRIGVTGTTETPDFALDVSEHPVDLRTEFNATVDGTTGDTILNSVHARLLHTVLEVSGRVMRAAGDAGGERAGGRAADSAGDVAGHVAGHSIDLSVATEQARVEDILKLGVKTNPPLLRGALMLRTRLSIPPGAASVTRKMRLQGRFAIRGATFSNPRFQESVDTLSLRAQGHPRQANPDDAQVVASQMGGTFAMANAVVDIPDLNYQMPGARAHLAGQYSLDGESFAFEGMVRTDATASQMLTGWKSVLAKPLDPLLKKNGAGVEVPIKVSGTRSDPRLAVDLDKMGLGFLSGSKDRTQQEPARHP